MLNIHTNIKDTLEHFKTTHKIPNLLFHGPSGSGKRTLLNDFICDLYGNDKERIKAMCMYVNCAHGKGIKFIREELKFFAKTHINSDGGAFKSVIMMNSDKLTMDAQSALRRCIELFNHNTRFFMVVENKYNLLKPILSRFCEIYVPSPVHRGKQINLYTYNLSAVYKASRDNKLESEISDFFIKEKENKNIICLCEQLYNQGYCGLDIIKLVEEGKFEMMTTERRYELLITMGRVRKEFRNEKLILLFLLNFIFVDRETSLANISFI